MPKDFLVSYSKYAWQYISVVSPMIFEALEASSERIFPLAGTVIVTLPFWMLFTF